nr:hypothetical protein [Tanacetum cinerariifolium]
MLPVAPPSPDYIPGPEEPQTPPAPQDEHELIQPHDPDFVLEPIYPKYIPLEDEHILQAEEQPLPPVVSPTAESLGYVAESDLEEDPKEYEEDETEDGLAGYPMDGGDDGDDDDSNSSGYDADDEDEDEEDEEEHLAPADSAVVIPTDELTSISLPPEAEVERLLAMPTLPPSPLTSLSPPSAEERSWFEVGESSIRGQEVEYRFADAVEAEIRHRAIGEVGYGIRDTWIDLAEAVPEMAPTTLEKRVDLLMRDRMTLQETVWIMKEEAYTAREAQAHSTEMAGLRETDRVRQSQIVETLRVMRDMRREMGDMQAKLLALCGQSRRSGQLGGDVRVPNHQDAPSDADSHI